MNETTNLNSELLSADARGRKHIPFAVFAVILIHVVLFMVLLIAAGCRAKARARLNAPPSEMIAQQQAISDPTPAAVATIATAPTNVTPAAIITEPLMVSEPPAEKSTNPTPPPTARKAAQKETAPSVTRPTATTMHKGKIYVVRAGDTVEKIAKMHRTSVQAIKTENKLKNEMLRPGQQLRVSTETTSKRNLI